MPTTYSSALRMLEVLQVLDAEQLGYVDTVLRGASIARLLTVIPPSDFKEDKFYEKGLAAESVVQTRALNQNPDKKKVNKYVKKVEQTIQLGGSVQIDYKLLDKKPNELDRRAADFLFDLGLVLDYKIINGDADGTDGEEFDGLKNRATGNMLVEAHASALSISASTANYRTFMSKFRTSHRRIKKTAGMQVVAVMNEDIWEGVQMGRDLMGANVLGTKHLDILNEEVSTLDGVPLLIVREDDIGNDILPNTESTGTESSIYLLGLGGPVGEDSLDIPNGIVALSEGGVNFAFDTDGNMKEVTIDYEYGLRVPDRSFCRLSNVKQ